MTAALQTLRGWPIGRYALIGYLIVLIVYTVRVGLPADRVDQTIWILIGIVAVKLGRPVTEHLRAVVDWLPLLAALLLYDYTRGIADTLGMPIRVSELVDAERALFGGSLPTVWLQERFFVRGEPQWWDVAAAGVYITHFVLPWAVAAGFYMASRGLWWRYIRMVLLLSYTGLLTYILVPAAPPWYAGQVGVIEEGVARTISYGWSVIGLQFAGTWLRREQAAVNEVAALPSLHAGFALLVSVALWWVVRNRLLRAVLVVFPLAMGLTLVYSGEHYVVDVLLGWAYVAAIVLGLRAWDRRRERRRRRRSAEMTGLAEPAARAGDVLAPDQQPVVTWHSGNGAADAGAGQGLLQNPDVVRADPGGDRRE